MLSLLLCSVLCLVIYFRWRKRDPSEPPVHPGGLPILGNAHQFLGDTIKVWQYLKELSYFSLKSGGVSTVYLGPKWRIYIITDPDDCLTLSNTCFNKPFVYDILKEWSANGLITSDVSIWKPHRKALNPMFSQQMLNENLVVFNKQARRLVDQISVESGRKKFDTHKYINLNTRETVCQIILGLKVDQCEKIINEYGEAANEMLEIFIAKTQKLWLHVPFIYERSSYKKRLDKCVKINVGITDEVIRKRKAELKKVNYQLDTEDGEAVTFLDLMLKLSEVQGTFTDLEIREHLDMLIFAGYDTTAETLTFALKLLGCHENAQQRLYQELQEVIGDVSVDVSHYDLAKLVYLDAVVKEVIRMYSTVPVAARDIDRDVKLKNYTLKAGSIGVISGFGIHRHPLWGPDVEKFRPERWLDSTMPDNPSIFAGFSLGKRNCIGRWYALISIKTTLAHFVRNYRIKADYSEMVVKFDVSIRSVSGHEVSLEKMLAVLLGVVSFILYYYWKWVSRYRGLKANYKLPPMYPGMLPIVGHAHLLIGNTTRLWSILKKFSAECLKQGGVTVGFIGTDIYYMIADPEDSVTAANACLQKHYAYDFGKPWMGDGLVLASGPTWKRHRKLLNPAFSLQVLHGFMGVFNEQARRQIKHFDAEVGRGKFDHLATLKHIALETVCLTAFGITADEDKDFNKLYMHSVDQILNIIALRFQNVWLQNEFIYSFTDMKKRQEEIVKVLNAMSNSVIKRKKEQIKTIPREQWEQQRRTTGIKCKALMDLLIELSEENTLTDKEIREEVDTAIVASYDTTSCLLAYIMMLLGTYPEAQEKMYNELNEIFGGTDRDVTKDDLPKMLYTDAVIKETLRLYPTGPVGLRYVDKDVQLKNYVMPAGSQCALFIYGVHYHSNWGPDRDQFRPERWLDPNNLPNPNMFAGFSIGKRACMGRTFATLSMKTTLSHVLRRYKITSDITQLKLKIDFLLKPVSGSFISIDKRS
ncbi:putative cytochrome P450 4d21 [Anticarsia gemmatalis]|uniref:putative cytochrome P450 4d21 n=1 Tax=Anticarsia gemmatalis TaxID=129554 RepID=UPI003F75B322